MIDHPKLFLSGIFAMLLTFVYDIILAWALYVFLRPVNPDMAMLSVFFRLIYTAMAMVALFNLLNAYHLANAKGIEIADKQFQVLQLVKAREFAMRLAYIVFGFYLILVGMLIWKASYIPGVMGVLMMLAGLSWTLTSIKPYLLKGYNFSWIMIFGAGEIVFGLWLLVKGSRVKASELILE